MTGGFEYMHPNRRCHVGYGASPYRETYHTQHASVWLGFFSSDFHCMFQIESNEYLILNT